MEESGKNEKESQEPQKQSPLNAHTLQLMMTSTLESAVRSQLRSLYQQLEQMEKSLSSKQK